MDSQRFEAEPETKKKSGMGGCFKVFLIVFGLGLLLVAVGLWWLTNNWKGLLVAGGTQAMVAGIDSSSLPLEEKQELKEELNRVRVGFEEGSISDQQVMSVLENLAQSPLVSLFVVSAIETGYVENSGLSGEEKTAASVTLQRFANGMMSEKISQEELDEVLDHISDRDAEGNMKIREKISDKELRAFLAAAAQKADEAEVPEEIEPVDPSDELKKVIDAALAE